jgi:hypothetical protein
MVRIFRAWFEIREIFETIIPEYRERASVRIG